jgi:hypothetical protein
MTDPRDIIAKSPMSPAQVLVVAITIALNALDGFDVLSISFASPGIEAEWQITRVALGFVLSMELIGMAFGSIFLGSLADKIGRRPTVLGCLVVMATGMFMVTTSTGFLGGLVSPVFALFGYNVDARLADLAVWRIITGLGIGGMLAAINAVVAEFSNTKRRDLNVAIMSIGYPVGAALGGFITSTGLELAEWRSVFYFGATVTIVMIPTVYFLMPESVHWLTRKQPAGALDKVNRTLTSIGHAAVTELPPVSADVRKRFEWGSVPAAAPDGDDPCDVGLLLPHHHVLLHRQVGADHRGRHGLRAFVCGLRPELAERWRRDGRHRARSALTAIQRQGPDHHGDAALDGRRDAVRAIAGGSDEADIDLHGGRVLYECRHHRDVRNFREGIPDSRARVGDRHGRRRRSRRVGARADHCRIPVRVLRSVG